MIFYGVIHILRKSIQIVGTYQLLNPNLSIIQLDSIISILVNILRSIFHMAFLILINTYMQSYYSSVINYTLKGQTTDIHIRSHFKKNRVNELSINSSLVHKSADKMLLIICKHPDSVPYNTFLCLKHVPEICFGKGTSRFNAKLRNILSKQYLSLIINIEHVS